MVFIPNETVTYGTANGATKLQGILQVNVCQRPDVSPYPALALADAVIEAFEQDTPIGSVARVQKQPWVSNFIEEDDRVTHPVTIPYTD